MTENAPLYGLHSICTSYASLKRRTLKKEKNTEARRKAAFPRKAVFPRPTCFPSSSGLSPERRLKCCRDLSTK
ncbi:hypothetical protein EBR25_00575 [bacterium]|nr:hypothetical protein [bacterium]